MSALPPLPKSRCSQCHMRPSSRGRCGCVWCGQHDQQLWRCVRAGLSHVFAKKEESA